MTNPILVTIEHTSKKSFATAADWPGWSRSGKTEELAVEALVAYADRYAAVARLAGHDVATDAPDLEVVERMEGGGATAYGVPEKVTDQDRRPVAASEGERLVGLVEAAWRTFDSIASQAPDVLRKGPRGGGRDTAKIVDHVLGAEQSYATNMGIETKPFETADRAALHSLRIEMSTVLRRPTDGSPIAGRRWTTRYAAHRIAWHALDHAWEIEDRTE